MAELGAACLCAELGVASAVREDHASSLAHWLSVLTADKRAIFTAASQAQKATSSAWLAALILRPQAIRYSLRSLPVSHRGGLPRPLQVAPVALSRYFAATGPVALR